ncbi:MAG: DNA polymerase III subunit gamma/tau [Acidobacteria bacterium]|nr:DNA polymerase III subunit gamma/tau [Acidobacteriota bacterium]MBI3657758.1 DNA polymerase III subunit gamma/tau [Acidobacteriota bacterium]
MSYQVTARKWRPQLFEDVIGQSAISQTLQNAIRHQRVAHGYLFAGPRGVGKTTTARIFARALNCRQGPTPSPCGVCDSCNEIAQGRSMDVIELDAASNRGIDDVREIREIVRYTPARDRYKIVIIDEAHMLTDPAFNALLKTLEEPPSYVVFILATTESHKMPATILSRCQQFEFRNLAYDLIVQRLRFIANQEQIEISDVALQQIAIASEGGMRDAQSIFDQVLAFSGRSVKEEDVASILGLVDQNTLDQLTAALAEKDAARILTMINDEVNAGRDVQNLCRKLILHIRHLMIVKVAGPEGSLLPLPADVLPNLVRQVELFSEPDLLRFYDIMAKTEAEMKWASQPRFHFEVGLLKIIQLRKLIPLEELLTRFSELLRQAGKGNSGSDSPRVNEPKPPSGSGDRPVAERGQTLPSRPGRDQATGARRSDANPVSRLLAAIETRQIILHAFLSTSSSIKWENDAIQIEIPHGSFEVVARQDNQDLIRTLGQEISGRTTTVTIVKAAETNSTTAPQLPEVAVPAAIAESAAGGETEPRPLSNLLSRAMSPPVIEDFLKVFSGKIPSR